jgi:invasion protein IalB
MKCSKLHLAAQPISVLFYAPPGANRRASHTKGTFPVRITHSLRILAAVGLLGLMCPISAMAQTGQPVQGKKAFGPRVNAPVAGAPPAGQAPPAAETVATHGAWQIQCTTLPANAGEMAGKKSCGMVQLTHAEKNEKVMLSLIVQKAKQGDKEQTTMRMMVPIGVYLPTGVALEIDGAAVGRAPFVRCRPQICEAFAEVSAESLAKLKKGTAANFIIYQAPGLGIPMKISLDGFSAALDSLSSL